MSDDVHRVSHAYHMQALMLKLLNLESIWGFSLQHTVLREVAQDSCQRRTSCMY